ncbi:MAG TPA: glycine--tRNA ligase [Phycisphaerales bacterium]|nr:glycine--tRNA ligase [Phycisphaerales bacterium]
MTTENAPPSGSPVKSMDAIMALCKRRGFIYQASEIYGGINGFWDYGPLGSQLKKNLREAWWQDMIMRPCWGKPGPDGKPVRCVPVETRIIQHPKVWKASGHIGGFNDPMVDCRETKGRYRYDHVSVYVPASGDPGDKPVFAFMKDSPSENKQLKKAEKAFGEVKIVPLTTIPVANFAKVLGPDAEKVGTLTEPRQFNLMFKTYIGATATEDDVAYLRPETAQGVFVQFKNVVDTTRVKVPFGIGNVGTSFRNEVTPRNFTFRSREFEQMELEFFCHPDESVAWYKFWRDYRMEWWKEIGLAGENLILREHEKDELSHYSSGTSDVEYRFPFTAPGFGELEGIAHRGNYDLTQHQKESGVKLEYNDTERGEVLPNGGRRGERYLPHCIEPAAGLDRGVLAILCEGYTVDPSRPSPEFMKINPRIAPIKAAVFPLVAKDGMPEVAEKLHGELVGKFWKLGGIEMDEKQSIGKRYARMDEAGCPYCFTVDGDTLKDQTVTVRDRDTGQQQRIAISQVAGFLAEKLGG